MTKDGCMTAMHEELYQFTRNDLWNLAPRPMNYNVIETKWIFKNTLTLQFINIGFQDMNATRSSPMSIFT
jgi:hypothetical protein